MSKTLFWELVEFFNTLGVIIHSEMLLCLAATLRVLRLPEVVV